MLYWMLGLQYLEYLNQALHIVGIIVRDISGQSYYSIMLRQFITYFLYFLYILYFLYFLLGRE